MIEVFNTAKRFQKDQDTSKYVSVVVLDEVGLAEDSPNLPLKALHPLLEDGTEGADDKQEVGIRKREGRRKRRKKESEAAKGENVRTNGREEWENMKLF